MDFRSELKIGDRVRVIDIYIDRIYTQVARHRDIIERSVGEWQASDIKDQLRSGGNNDARG